MRLLREYLSLICESSDVPVPLEDIDRLIKRFARNPGGPVKLHRGYMPLSRYDSVRGKGIIKKIGGMYDASTRSIILNEDPRGLSTEDFVETVLHEIGHYNQHMAWLNDEGFREEFTEGQLPIGLQDIDLSRLTFTDITQFWLSRYGEDANHEMDAMIFATSNLDSALAMLEKGR